VAKEFTHEPDAHRYVLRIDGALVAVVDYAINGNSISFTRTYTNPAKRGHGYAAEIVKFAADDVEQTTPYQILPMCWYVADWFEKNPDRAGLLTR
jgi:predicted GNAT family acetyltransferase